MLERLKSLAGGSIQGPSDLSFEADVGCSLSSQPPTVLAKPLNYLGKSAGLEIFFFPTVVIFPTHHHHFKIRKQCYAAVLLFETFHCTILSQGVGEDQPLHSSAFFDGQNLGIKVKVPTWAT